MDDVRLTDEQVASFHENGFVSVDRITSEDELAWIAEVYDELFRDRRGGFRGGFFDLSRPYDADGDDDLPQVLFPERRIPALRDTFYVRNARAIGGQLLGAPDSDLQAWGHMITKPAHHGHETPWHQDEAYWQPDLDYRAVGAWMPLDDADTDNGCMCFIPGSHHFELLPHRHIGNDPAVHGLEVAAAIDASQATAVPLRAGGATFHHPRTLHFTSANRTARRRRAFANEVQTAPTPKALPDHRPWFDEGKAAWDRRTIRS